MAGLGNGDEEGVGLGPSRGHAAAGDLALENTFANVLAVVIMAGAAGQHREGEDAATQALD